MRTRVTKETERKAGNRVEGEIEWKEKNEKEGTREKVEGGRRRRGKEGRRDRRDRRGEKRTGRIVKVNGNFF